MVRTLNQSRGPLGLVVTGEANEWLPALEQLIGRQWLNTMVVRGGNELLSAVSSGLADAAVLDEEAGWDLDVLQMLRMIRRIDAMLPVVVLTRHTERRWMESALRLTAFSIVNKPLELEELLRQIHRIMARMDQMLRGGPY